ncbi:efflux RND transporter permease subunit [Salmonella enterica subsp. enterica]|nr:efflux RND transporter permease subunit [Salmonella enterica subsp. enterica]
MRYGKTLALPADVQRSFRAVRSPSGRLWAAPSRLIVAAVGDVYIVLGVLYESLSIRSILTMPTAGVGALLALIIAGSRLDIIAIIGIVL